MDIDIPFPNGPSKEPMNSSRAVVQSLNGPRTNCLLEMLRAPGLDHVFSIPQGCAPASGGKSERERQLIAAVGQGIVIAFQLLGTSGSNLCCSEGQSREGGV